MLVVIVLAILSAGCTDAAKREDKVSGTLKVAFFDQAAFMRLYGERIQRHYPDLKLETVAVPLDKIDDPAAYSKFLRENGIDIAAMHDYGMFQSTMQRGELADLRPLAKEDGFDLDVIPPSLLALWSEPAAGTVHAIAPSFSILGLFVNNEAFTRYGAQPPGGSPAWGDVFAAAALLKDAEDVEPLEWQGMDKPLDWMLAVAAVEQLRLVDRDGKHVLLGTPAWQKVFQSVVKGHELGVLSLDGSREAVIPDPSQQPVRAMLVDSTGNISNRRGSDTNWQPLPLPGIEAGGKRTPVLFPALFAIPASSVQPELAWKLLAYVGSEEWNRVTAGASTDFPIRADMMPDNKVYDVAGALNGEMSAWTMEKLPRGAREALQPIVSQTVRDVLEGKLSADEAIRRMTEESDAALRALR